MYTVGLVTSILRNGGATVRRRGNGYWVPAHAEHRGVAWAVAVQHEGNRVVKFTPNDPFVDVLAEIDRAAVDWDFTDWYLGAWIDDGVLYIDHVILTNRPLAEKIGRENGQSAIYNVDTGETVRLIEPRGEDHEPH